ncbi:MAG: BadF/BadG/BcrA/BcrD ATPase family protein [Vicinamibacterales bacterium]
MHVLGIDAGGSKTVALLATGEGRIVEEERAGGANLRTHGELVVEKTLHEVIERITSRLTDPPAAVCLGIAGVDRADDAATIRGVMRRLGFRDHTLIVNDALIALVAGAGQPTGLVLVAGTGSIAYGVNASGAAARSGGWGPVLADEGSGYWIGRRALVSIMRQADGRGPRTALTAMVLRQLGLSRADDLVQEIYEGAERRQLVATLGPLVDQARADGDVVAAEILRDASVELAGAAQSVITRLQMRGDVFSTFLSGGVFKSMPWLAADVAGRLTEVAPRAACALLTAEPAAGAVTLALAEAAGTARVPTYQESDSPS